MKNVDDNQAFKLSSYEMWFFGSPITFGLLCLLSLGCTAYSPANSVYHSWQLAIKAISLLFLAAGAAFAGGAFLGFLFGVPRVAPPAVIGVTAAANTAEPVAQRATIMTSTSNLVEIADWLLKLLLGAGLTQYHSILHTILRVSTDLGAGLAIPFDPTQQGVERGVAISFSLAYFFVWGCIMSYVLTQEWMPLILDRRTHNN
ncbi:hypothetical protein [Hymenobacter rubripertinctus]|uniref:Uncharacterized protein n=1 Tax=Hymenobacter rubripertinctus TaxID=2029981 RepID=A0A418QRV9_9BACT|nr:hypothetical protein [Hymenobacter rubripertinctus]RIY07818.1 hypothetical protein D0T11_15695 [Hymenobacter rubripertinctus]